MTTITVQAVYRDGAIHPQVELDLPNDTPVQVQVTPLPTSRVSTGSLFGAFPELAVLTGDDFDWAKRLWEHGLEKQYGGQTVIVERSGTPMAAIIPLQEYEQLIAEREERFQILDDIRRRMPDLPIEEVEQDVAQAIAAVRRGEADAAGRP